MGSIFRFFSTDHRRLEGLLQQASAAGDRVEPVVFGQFRAGLLKHIGMEEKILLPAARAARGGEPLPLARRLRLDHGAIASLLVPTPTPAVVDQLLSILEPHNRFEEKRAGLYDVCDELLGGHADVILEKLRAFPEVPLSPHHDGALVQKTIENAIRLARAGWEHDE